MNAALHSSLRSLGRIYASNGYALPTSLIREAADLISSARSQGETWTEIGRAAQLDPRTIKHILSIPEA